MKALALFLFLAAPSVARAASSLTSGVSCGVAAINWNGSTYTCTDHGVGTSVSSFTVTGVGVSSIQPVNSVSSTTIYAYFINKSSGAMSPGTIVALSTFTNNAINFSVAAATTQVIGVVSPSTIAQGAAGLVAISGFVKVLFAAATPMGYQVQVSATAGNAQGAAAPAAGSSIGVLTENCAAGALCWVFLR